MPRATVITAELKKRQQRREFLNSVVGGGYEEFWNDRHRYRVVKGGRGSKKSTTAALWFIENLMTHKLANLVVVRKIGNTHKNSTFAQLKWAANRLEVSHKWKFVENPLEARYLPTGQKILFYGFDDASKLNSMTVDVGVLCWAWFEEAFEIEDADEFDTFDESIRGEMPPGLWKQVTLTYNPWVNNHWTKTRFWDNVYPNTFRLTTTHTCNEFLDEADHQKIEELAITNPLRYKVVGLGEYGLPGGAYFDEFREDIHVIEPGTAIQFIDDRKYRVFDYGLDMLACYWIDIDSRGRARVYKELYEPGLIVSAAANRIKEVNGDDKIYETIAPPDMLNRQKDSGKSIKELFYENDIDMVIASNDRVAGWLNLKEWLKPYETVSIETGEPIVEADLLISKACPNLIRCLPQLQRDDKDPNDVSQDVKVNPHELTHGPDALRYFFAGRPCPKKPNAPTKPKKLIELLSEQEKIQRKFNRNRTQVWRPGR